MSDIQIPFPTPTYDDGVVSFVADAEAPNLYQMFGVSKEYYDQCVASIEAMDGMVCTNDECPKHQDVAVKYELHGAPGANIGQAVAHGIYTMNPQNAAELGIVLATIFDDALQTTRKQKQESPFGGLGELLAGLTDKLRRPERTPEQEIARLLAEDAAGQSDLNFGGVQFDAEGNSLAESLGISRERDIELMGGIMKQIALLRDKKEMGINLVVKALYDNVPVHNIQEQELRGIYMGTMIHKLEIYRKSWEETGAAIDWSTYEPGK